MHSAPFGKAARQGPALAARVQQAQHGTKHIVQINQGGVVFLRVLLFSGGMRSNCSRQMPPVAHPHFNEGNEPETEPSDRLLGHTRQRRVGCFVQQSFQLGWIAQSDLENPARPHRVGVEQGWISCL